jgi:hypothetical protein
MKPGIAGKIHSLWIWVDSPLHQNALKTLPAIPVVFSCTCIPSLFFVPNLCRFDSPLAVFVFGSASIFSSSLHPFQGKTLFLLFLFASVSLSIQYLFLIFVFSLFFIFYFFRT